jgi:hemerythrin-like domain-containing protein
MACLAWPLTVKPEATMAKAKKAKAKKAKKQGAIELLKRDHAEVKKAFKEFEKAKYKDPSACKAFLASICNAITLHATVEEEIFYPAVRAKIDDDDLMNEALVEHKSAKQLIADIEKLAGDDDMLKACAMVLSEYINHHVREEENEIFPKAKRAKLDLEGLAEQMLARKDELKARL